MYSIECSLSETKFNKGDDSLSVESGTCWGKVGLRGNKSND